MPTQDYRNAKGERIPGTTTIISQNLGWNKQPLLWWANQLGREGKSHRDAVEKAADIGSEAHAMVEARIKGLPIPAGSEKATAAFQEYLEWEKRTNILIIDSEISLVSEKYQFGSTLDAMGRYEGEHEMLDWKSSNGCYPDHVIQLAAYGNNWLENHPEKRLRRVHLCRFGKEGGFHHHSWAWPDLEPAWNAFLHLRALHDIQGKVKGMI